MNGLSAHRDAQALSRRRVRMVTYVVGAVVTVYIGYLFELQIVSGHVFKQRAAEVARRVLPLPARRGEIFDRNYDVPLASNRPSFAVDLIPGEVERKSLGAELLHLASLLSVPETDLNAKVPASFDSLFEPIELAGGVPFETVSFLAEHIDGLPGIAWHSKPVRTYLSDGSLSHVIGYVGSITREELQVLYNRGYNVNSTLGKNGIEKQYDAILRGVDGKRLNIVDVRGRRVRDSQIQELPPENGKNVVLTIDRHLQELAEKALGERIGTVVVMKPSTGEILALVSYPWYDPNIFSGKGGADGMREAFLDPRFPFVNRAIQSTYAPASTFKVIMSAADLEEGVLPSTQVVDCTGEMEFGDRLFHDWQPTGHGPVDLAGALAESCDVYFWTLGTKYLGIDRIVEYAQRFGLGRKTGVDLPGEVAGLVPTPEWKQDYFHSPWLGGDTMNVSIGQGNLLVTPLQLANVVAMVANAGVIYRPHLLKEVRDPTTGAILESTRPEVLASSGMSRTTFQRLQSAMRGVITKGTANVVVTTGAVKVAGKTGTGEVGRKEHFTSWFASYGPFDAAASDDQIVVVTMVEATNDWEWWAPKAANIIYQGYFGHQSYEEAVNSLVASASWYLQPIRINDR